MRYDDPERPPLPRALLHALAVIFAAIPVAFGVIRAVQTGRDVRYIWVAAASLFGAIVVTATARRYRGSSTPVLVLCASFFASAVLAVCAGWALGTRLGPGLLVVAAGFAGCFSVASVLNVLARRHR
jgi:hypothetical protein